MKDWYSFALEEKVKYFISTKSESEYWDFKKEWSSPYSTIKDILAFSNTLHLEDSYIIIGVDNEFKVEGIDADKSDRSCNNLNDTFSKLNFIGNIKPSYTIEHIIIDDKRLDVIIIKNSFNTPFMLEKTRQDKIEPKIVINAYSIYSRNGNSNSENDYGMIVKLWQKRFGLLCNNINYVCALLDNIFLWEEVNESSNINYSQYCDVEKVYRLINNHKLEIVILNEDEDKHYNKFEFYVLDVTNFESTYYQTIKIYNDNCLISSFQVCTTDSCYLTFLVPNYTYLDKNIYYRYYLKDSCEYKITKFLIEMSKTPNETEYAFEQILYLVLLFNDVNEQKDFEEYIIKHMNRLDQLILEQQEKDTIFKKNCGEYNIDIKLIYTSLALNKMLIDFRKGD